jgi:hypothetical protein
MTLGAHERSHAASFDVAMARAIPADARLEIKVRRLHDLVKQRDGYFRRSIMADSAMGVMLSLFLAELAAIPVSESSLALTNILDSGEARCIVESLLHAGLVIVTGDNPQRWTVGLTPLGSARMRSFISDHPDI